MKSWYHLTINLKGCSSRESNHTSKRKIKELINELVNELKMEKLGKIKIEELESTPQNIKKGIDGVTYV